MPERKIEPLDPAFKVHSVHGHNPMIIEAEYIGKVSCPQCASTQLRTKDRTYCGHILDFRTRENTAALIDRCTRLMVFIPDSQAAREADLDRDRSAEVRSVNRAR